MNTKVGRMMAILLVGLTGLYAASTQGAGAVSWAWNSGSQTNGQNGNYGTKGVASATNVPGARKGATMVFDSSNNLWLFGGQGQNGYFNDLWKYSNSQWTWVAGSSALNQAGNYGTRGHASASNVPGGRDFSAMWIDASNNIWLFGGNGYDSGGDFGDLGDLWEFNGTNWIWISGSNDDNVTGVYGQKGQFSSSNAPGARAGVVSWIDASNNLWIFGGFGYPASGRAARLNDLWEFNGSQWAWMSGSKLINQAGVWGQQGVAASTNIPSAREWPVGWIDNSGGLWLMGGYGYDSKFNLNGLNDLWNFNGTNWTWQSGGTLVLQNGNYGTQGVGSASNVPGTRYTMAAGFNSTSGNFWLFGGNGLGATGKNYLQLNDLWSFGSSVWTWWSGSTSNNQAGSYGAQGVGSPTNVPGAREGMAYATDKQNNFWVFGGQGFDGSGNSGIMNDLWETPIQ